MVHVTFGDKTFGDETFGDRDYLLLLLLLFG
jgi:hypothetical protein